MTTKEQIKNRGFETGDFTDWITSGDVLVVTTNPHSGTYCALINSNTGDYFKPTIANIKVSDLVSLGLWARTSSGGVCNFGFRVFFTDGDHAFLITGISTSWQQFDYVAVLIAYGYGSKTINEIQIINLSPIPTYIDDVTLLITVNLPTVVTDDPTCNICNGNITATGGDDCDERGFEWGMSSGVYTESWTETGTFGTGTFSHSIAPNFAFYYRAKAHNSAGWAYGAEKQTVICHPEQCVDSIFKLYIDGNDPPTTERYYMNIHYTKSHPNQDPDTFEIIVDPDVGTLINYFDRVKITKYDITEFYGFVEEITPTVGEDGLEYRLTGRCWKLITWKKWTERFQESREIGPVDPMTGEIESGFFGQVKPEELIKFILRVPMSEHPKGKVRHKIGWGIPSDLWSCCANVTAECRYADWVGLRYAGLAWRNRGTVDTLVDYTLDVDAFILEYQEWFTDGANPWINSDGGGFIHTDAGTGSPYRMKYFTFEDFGVDPQSITNVYLNLDMFGEFGGGRIEVYLWDGAWQYLGKYKIGVGGYIHHLTTINVTEYLDTVDKVKNARVYFKRFDQLWMAIDHCYLTVKASLVTNPADQRIGDYFVVNLGKSYDDVTAILIECRNNPTMYARNYNIQYAIISDCCAEGGNDAQWHDFEDPINPINETNNDVRDILHSWKPQDDVRCIRIKLTGDADYPWEISQIYIWQSDAYKYRVLDEGD